MSRTTAYTAALALALLALLAQGLLTVHERTEEQLRQRSATALPALVDASEEPAPVFPDPCELDSVVCEGEPGWAP